jgi:hypothetical protein
MILSLAQNIATDNNTTVIDSNINDDGNGNGNGSSQRNRNYDQFNYDSTIQDDVHNNFGPEDWGNILCPDLGTCVRSYILKRK